MDYCYELSTLVFFRLVCTLYREWFIRHRIIKYSASPNIWRTIPCYNKMFEFVFILFKSLRHCLLRSIYKDLYSNDYSFGYLLLLILSSILQTLIPYFASSYHSYSIFFHFYCLVCTVHGWTYASLLHPNIVSLKDHLIDVTAIDVNDWKKLILVLNQLVVNSYIYLLLRIQLH